MIWDMHGRIRLVMDRYNDKFLALDNRAVNAFVTFRSMAAQRHAITANEVKWQRNFLRCMSSKKKTVPHTKFLSKYRLQVSRAIEPELI